MNEVSYTGQCLCGAVSLKIASKPATVLSCFCTHCSKGAGGPSQVIAKFSQSDVAITVTNDSLGYFTFTDTSSSAPKEKAFCRVCATPLFTVPAAAKGKFYLIRTAVLDGGLDMKPENEIFTMYRPDWVKGTDGSAQWETMRK